MEMLFTQKYEEVHKLVDAILDAVLILLPSYCVLLADYL